MSIGKRFLCSIVNSQDKSALFNLDIFPELFRESELDLLYFIVGHLESYGVIPDRLTIEDKLGDVWIDAPEPPTYYREEVGKRYTQSSLKKVMQEMTAHLSNHSPYEALQLMSQAALDLSLQKQGNKVIDYREAKSLIHHEYLRVQQDDGSDNMLFGWPTLDDMTGGIRGGDFCSVVGRPAAGKTFEMLYIAHHHWRNGGAPLFISMEMNRVIVTQRLTAIDATIPITRLLKAEMTKDGLGKLWGHLDDLQEKENPFWIIDGNLTTTVEDIMILCRQLQPTAVFVDGAYLLRHQNTRMSKWDRMAENAELLKQRVSTDLDLPTIASYQLRRGDSKKKKNSSNDEGVGLEDIYGTDSIGQLSTVCLGLLGAPSVEQEQKRVVSILKGRNGEVGKFLVNWNFLNMGFYEIDQNGVRVKTKQELEIEKESEDSGYEQEAFKMKFVD